MTVLENISVWKQSLQLAKDVYKICRSNDYLKRDFDLKSQMQRSAVSIPSNIAEWSDRSSNKDYLRFLYIARGSCSELKTQLYIAEDFLLTTEFEKIMQDNIVVHKMINGLIRAIKLKNNI